MIFAQNAALDRQSEAETIHPVMGLIAALWTNFGSGKNAVQKRQMMEAWETALDDIPVKLQLLAIEKKARSGHVWPPSSPAEIRTWCNEVQLPMDGMDVQFYQSCIDTGVLEKEFCQRQIDKYKAAKVDGRIVYAGFD